RPEDRLLGAPEVPDRRDDGIEVACERLQDRRVTSLGPTFACLEVGVSRVEVRSANAEQDNLGTFNLRSRVRVVAEVGEQIGTRLSISGEVRHTQFETELRLEQTRVAPDPPRARRVSRACRLRVAERDDVQARGNRALL